MHHKCEQQAEVAWGKKVCPHMVLEWANTGEGGGGEWLQTKFTSHKHPISQFILNLFQKYA